MFVLVHVFFTILLDIIIFNGNPLQILSNPTRLKSIIYYITSMKKTCDRWRCSCCLVLNGFYIVIGFNNFFYQFRYFLM